MGKDRRRTRNQKINTSALIRNGSYKTAKGQLTSLSVLSLLPGNEQENQHFLFFRAITASELAGPFDFGFWTCNTLQYSHVDPALWHATIALGAMHHRLITDSSRSYCWHPETNSHVRFVILQFNKSIMNLMKTMSKQALNEHDKIIVLTTCVLFTCLCSLQGKQNQAFMHITNGMKLIHEWGLRGSFKNGNQVAMNMLLLTFTQLDSQGIYIRRRLGLDPAEQGKKYSITLPLFSLEPFFTCLQAYVDLERLINHLIQLHASDDYISLDPDSTISKQKELLFQAFTVWDTRFKGYLATNPQFIEERSVTILKIRHLFANTLFNDPSKGELGYDKFIDQYTIIVNLAETILGARNVVASNKDDQRRRKLGFSLSVVVAEPLLFTAMHCRKPSIRHQALRLLKTHPRREGIFDGILATKLVEDYMAFEEKSCRRNGSPLDDDALINTNSNICTSGRWICQNHRISFRRFFMEMSGLEVQTMERWTA